MMDAYFERIKRLSNNEKLESRLRFMLLDVVEQRLRGWETRRKKEGPKKIEVGAAGCRVLFGVWFC
jgi:translation initiation factor 4G